MKRHLVGGVRNAALVHEEGRNVQTGDKTRVMPYEYCLESLRHFSSAGLDSRGTFMLSERSGTFTPSFPKPDVSFCHSAASRNFLQSMTTRIARILVSVLVAAAIVASPTHRFLALGANLHHHSSNHLPRKHHQTPLVLKMRTALAASARLSSVRDSESRPQATKRFSSPTCRPNAFGCSSSLARLHQVFRPLRC